MATTLEFRKDGRYYIAEFMIKNAINLHLERPNIGEIHLKQRGSENGNYDYIKDFGFNKGGDKIIDVDIVAAVYPKHIQIQSEILPTLAEITDSESSGGGAGTSNNANMEYFNLISDGGDYEDLLAFLPSVSYVVKLNIDGEILIMPSLMAQDASALENVVACAIDFSQKCYYPNPTGGETPITTIKDYLTIMGGLSQDMIDNLPRLTEEEFYNLKA